MEEIVDTLKVNEHFVPNRHSFRSFSWQAATAYKHKMPFMMYLTMRGKTDLKMVQPKLNDY